jgi:hypothetical protein
VCLEVIVPLTRFVCAHRDHAHRAGNAKTLNMTRGILLHINICCAPPWGVPTRPKSAPKSRRLWRRSMDQYMSLVSATTPTRPPVRGKQHHAYTRRHSVVCSLTLWTCVCVMPSRATTRHYILMRANSMLFFFFFCKVAEHEQMAQLWVCSPKTSSTGQRAWCMRL